MNIKRVYILLFAALCIVGCGGGEEPTPHPTSVLAFPGAEGGGKYTSGGRGGVVVHVTTLSDERDKSTGQPIQGSLRKAVQMV